MTRRAIAVLATVVPLSLVAPAAAQDKYPSKPVRIVIPYTPGGATDIIARLVGEHLRVSFGQPFVVENKPGAFGIIALEEMARAKPDGHTLFVGNTSTNAITPLLFAKRMSIDYEREVVPVGRLIDMPSFFMANKNFPATTYAEFVNYAKKHPGRVRYGTAGVASIGHYQHEVLARQEGIELLHVPNKGGAAAVVKDLLAGDVHVALVNLSTGIAHMKTGLARALAVTGDERLPEFPDIPSFRRVGHSGDSTTFWQATFAPAATPKDVLERLHRAIVEALNAPAMLEILKRNNMRPIPTTSLDEEKAWLAREMALWRKITSEVKIEMN